MSSSWNEIEEKAEVAIDREYEKAMNEKIGALQSELIKANEMLRSCHHAITHPVNKTDWHHLQIALLDLLESERQYINSFDGYKTKETAT